MPTIRFRTTLPRPWVYLGLSLLTLALVACRYGLDVIANEPVAPGAVAAAPARVPGDIASLGEAIFHDKNLSEPRGTACVSCHGANTGLASNNGSTIGVAVGSKPASVGLRNTMANGYTSFIPPLKFVTDKGETEASGGHFWDGRADTMQQQALGPLLNPLELNNPDRQAVVGKIAASAYAPLFRQTFGAGIFADTNLAFEKIGVAIAAFEQARLQPFTSKYDAMVRGKAEFSSAEQRGMALFMDPKGANCAGCHLMDPKSAKPEDSLFSEFTYYATGVPRNKEIPRNADPRFFDLGLCGPERSAPTLPADVPADVRIEDFCGKFRMPTLRNVAQREAFMHNGYFKDLNEVVRFYSTRNSNPRHWYGPGGKPNDLPAQYAANIEKTKAPFDRKRRQGPVLSEADVSDVVSFLQTLSDGYTTH